MRIALRHNIIVLSTIFSEAPAMLRQDRQSFIDSFGAGFEIAFNGANRGKNGAGQALFSRLNRQGLLEEIEKRQAQLSALPGEQQQVVMRLHAVTQQLSSLSLSREQRATLRKEGEQLSVSYRLLPELVR